MSHDQKPGRMRLVSGGGVAPERRRTDLPVPAPSPVVPAAKATRKPVLLAAVLFVVGCAIGVALLPLVGLV